VLVKGFGFLAELSGRGTAAARARCRSEHSSAMTEKGARAGE